MYVTDYLSNLSGYAQGILNNITNTISGLINGSTHGYNSVDDDEETNTDTAHYRTIVTVGTPIRQTKFIFVPELIELYTREELDTAYHSYDEYANAVNKYGFIYKTQKFENADTAEKLFDYAKDWIKNNYHGGITSFTINAIDMHLTDRQDYQKITVGRRIPVVYIDPDTQQKTRQSLTCISVEYDLNNPEKNQYKIGIPDIALNKVYGETSKKGGGGGGGKTSDEEDEETNTEVDGVSDLTDQLDRFLDEKTWAHMFSFNQADDGTGLDLSGLLTPGERNPASNTFFAMAADALKSTIIESAQATINKIKSTYIDATGGIDTDTFSANTSNTGRTNAESIDCVNTATAKTVKSRENVEAAESVLGKNATITEKVTSNSAEFASLKVGSNTVSFGRSGSNPTITINGTTYTLALKTN